MGLAWASGTLRTLRATAITAGAARTTGIGAAWATTVTGRTITRGSALAIAASTGATVSAGAITALTVTP